MRWLVDEAYADVQVVRLVFGQPQHPPDSVPVRSLPSGGGPEHRPAAGISLHPQARQLAESCPEFAEGMAQIEFSVLSRSRRRGSPARRR